MYLFLHAIYSLMLLSSVECTKVTPCFPPPYSTGVAHWSHEEKKKKKSIKKESSTINILACHPPIHVLVFHWSSFFADIFKEGPFSLRILNIDDRTWITSSCAKGVHEKKKESCDVMGRNLQSSVDYLNRFLLIRVSWSDRQKSSFYIWSTFSRRHIQWCKRTMSCNKTKQNTDQIQ